MIEAQPPVRADVALADENMPGYFAAGEDFVDHSRRNVGRVGVAVGTVVLTTSLAMTAHVTSPNIPSVDTLTKTEQLLQSPSPVDVVGLEISTWPRPGQELTAADQERGRYLANKAIADHYGLSVHDASPYVVDLDEDMRQPGGPQLPFDTYFSRAQAYFQEYGINLHLLQPGDTVDKGERRPTETELNGGCQQAARPKQCARKDILEMVHALSGLPQEYIDLIEVKDAVYSIGDKYAAAYAQYSTRALHFEVGAQSVTVFTHEAGHFLAHKEHAGGTDDRVLVSGVGFWDNKPYDHGHRYGAKNNPAHTNGAYTKNVSKTQQNSSYNQALSDRNWAAACRVEQHRNDLGKDVVFADNYGATSPGEHATQFNANLTDVFHNESSGVSGNFFDPRTPTLRAEAIGNLARLYKLNPKLAAYFVMRRGLNHQPTNFMTGCSNLKLQKEGRLPVQLRKPQHHIPRAE